MGGEILLSNHDEKEILEGDGNPFEVLEEKVMTRIDQLLHRLKGLGM